MKTYIQSIQYVQKFLLGVGIFTLSVLPLVILFSPKTVDAYSVTLYSIVHFTVFFVMLIRPLADIWTTNSYVRPLVILRKGMGVVSASIVVSFILAKLIADPSQYVVTYFGVDYWSIAGGSLLAHLADVTAILLLITSNAFSKRVLGAWWKRIQRLAYVYFYASGLFVATEYGEKIVMFYMVVVTLTVITAYFKNNARKALINATI